MSSENLMFFLKDIFGLSFMLAFTRWLFMLSLIPFLGGRTLPALFKIAISALLSIFVVIFLKDNSAPADPSNPVFISLLFVKEAMVGFLLGFIVSLIFLLYEIAGQIMDLARGANLASQLVPELPHQSSTMGSFLYQMNIAIFLSLGFHRPLLTAIISSFETIPLLMVQGKQNTNLFYEILKLITDIIEYALLIAMPVIITSFLIDLGFGLINRAAPMINAHFLSLPAKIAGGLFIVSLAIVEMMRFKPELLDRIISLIAKVPSLF